MAQPYVTGPAHLYVGFGKSGGFTYRYLGTAERWPKIAIRPQGTPFFNDIGGSVPFDMAFMGEEAFVAADVNRFNESTYAILASRPRPLQNHGINPASATPIRGTNYPGDIGSLYVSEGLAYGLVVQFPYASKPSQTDMPAGYLFHAAYLVGPDELEPLGTTPRKIRLMWHALRKYDPRRQTLTLYSNTLPALPTPD